MMPYQNELWSTRYPYLVNILNDQPCVPKYNSVQNNVIYNSPEMEIAASAQENSVIRNNWMANEDLGFVDAANGNFQLRDDSPVFDQLPDFQPIPFHKIGLYTAQDQIAYLQQLLDQYKESGDVNGSLANQLSNALDQVKHQFQKGSEKQALHHINKFLKHLNNPPMQNRISVNAKANLTEEASALVGMWSEDDLAKISVHSSKTALGVGDNTDLWIMGDSLTGRYVDLFGKVEYSSENPQVAAVGQNGVVTAVAPGEVWINVTEITNGGTDPIVGQIKIIVYDSFLGSVDVTIDPAIASVGGTTQTVVTGTNTNGGQANLSDAAITYTSSDPDVASVDENGMITLKKVGGVSITANVELYGVSKSAYIPFVVHPTSESRVPAPWQTQNYGDAKGDATYDNGKFYIISNGADVWGGADRATFVYQNITVSDSTVPTSIIATVDAPADTKDSNAAPGIMFRDDNTAESKNVNFRILPGGGLLFVWRTNDGGQSDYSGGPQITYPATLKLTRVENNFTAYYKDGDQWIQVANAQLNMEQDVIGGIFAFSAAYEAKTVSFSNVEVQRQ
jgi:regulation of enolase protein 1 (concanavalin A-like superfamily)